jgi:signal transduction histidine kinase
MVLAWTALAAMVAFAIAMTARANQQRRLRQQEQAIREEFAAYAQLDTSAHRSAAISDRHDLARRVCAAVARHSPCRQAALLLRDAEQRLKVAGSAGIDDLLLRALNEWGERFARERRTSANHANPVQRRSYTVTLGPMENYDTERRFGALGCRQVIMFPLWAESGALLGALAAAPALGARVDLDRALPPLEALAGTLARSLENASLSAHLERAEKMAGLGQLARGVAHELNNPLTAVLGHSELLAATATDARVRESAHTITTQALRMKETVESLLDFWRPVNSSDASVELAELLQGLTAECRGELARRGIDLLLETDTEGPAQVRGNAGRLRLMIQHLLSNAAEAIAAHGAATAPQAIGESAEAARPAVRITLAREGRTLQLVISDNGAGFSNPARAFDPFYSTLAPRQGEGMGLAVSYGIVREHGGDISAFNLHPHGAAVVVELPLAAVMAESGRQQAVAA